MRRVLFLIASIFIAAGSLAAQSRSFSLHYIAHDVDTDAPALAEKLRFEYNNALADKSTISVFYLANEISPVIVKVHLPSSGEETTFEDLISTLLSKDAHDIYPEWDRKNLIKILDNFGWSEGSAYSSSDFSYYVSSGFWDKGLNESIISYLYFILDCGSREQFKMNIYCSAEDHIAYDKEYPLGKMNLCADSYVFKLTTY